MTGEIIAASPYSFLVRKETPEEVGHAHEYFLQFRPPKCSVAIEPAFLAEAKAALDQIRRDYPKDRERELRMVVGLHLSNLGVSVIPALDPEATAWVSPKFLIDALGRWPAKLLHPGTYQPQCIVIETEKHEVWLACMSKAKWGEAAAPEACEHKPYQGRCLRCGEIIVASDAEPNTPSSSH